MKNLVSYIALACLAISPGLLGAATAESKWTVEGTKVKLNGSPFIFQGVNYSPVPYGASPQYSVPYGSYFIPKAKAIWQRDIDKMREMGVNSIRLYAGDNKTVGDIDLGDYQEFLDYLYNGGTDSIYVFLYYWHGVGAESKSSPDFEDLKSKAVSLLSRWKDHPAVAGFVTGNETEGDANVYGTAAYWQGVGELADALKAVAPNKLIINAMVDDGNPNNNTSPKVQAAFANRQYLGNLDIIGINCYRGPDLGTNAKVNDHSVRSNSVFLGYARSWTENPKPLLITEFGVSWGTGGSNVKEADSAAQQKAGANYITQNWTVIRNNYQNKDGDSSVCVGGFVFSWVDEWYKTYVDSAPTPLVHNPNPNQKPNSNPIFPGGQWDEEWFGIMRIDETKVNPYTVTWDINKIIPDPLIPRSSFGALKALWKDTQHSVFTAHANTVAEPSENGFWSTWFGHIYENYYPWIYHAEHDWAYAVPSDEDGVWFWDESFGEWFWTSEEVYPWMYRSSNDSWVYYFEGYDDPQYFYDYNTGQVFTHLTPLTPAN